MPSCSSRINSRSTSGSEAGGRFDLEVVEHRAGLVILRAAGRGVRALFEGEAGGHRWQRVPPTEKRGRVHSSTITVAVLDEPDERELVIAPHELDWFTCRSTGAGGQHLQKTDSAVTVVHLPTGLQVRCEAGRSQHHNRMLALQVLRARLAEDQARAADTERAQRRRAQIGSGQRADKRRTIRVQDDSVTDHQTGRVWRYRDYVRGTW